MSSDTIAILAIDIGTTNLKCTLYDEKLQCLHSCCLKLNVMQPLEGYSELDPHHLIQILKSCIETCIKNKPDGYKLKCFGISTQRNSMILWNKKTGRKYTNFILWNDQRPTDLCNLLNSGFVFNVFKKASYFYTLMFTNHRLKSFSNYKVETTHIAPKLIRELDKLNNKLEPDEFKQIQYGTIETWLLWNITKEKVFATDVTCASSTGLYDMYRKQWSNLICNLFGVPMNYFPTVYDTCYHFGNVKEDIVSNLNQSVPITSIIGDSQSSLISECAFKPGDCVITIGTGSFISVNVGNKPLSSNNGAFPLANFKHNDKEIFILHSPVSSSGIAIDWAKSIGLFNEYSEIEGLLNSTENSGGVYFIAAFGFLNLPSVEKNKIATGFIGLKSNTTKAQMFRSIIDSIAFSITVKMHLILKDLKLNNIKLRSIRISGGVSQSNFFCQYLSNLLEFPIERSETSSTSSTFGAAFLAGLGAKVYNSISDLEKFRRKVEIFKPDVCDLNVIKDWEITVKRFTNWI